MGALAFAFVAVALVTFIIVRESAPVEPADHGISAVPRPPPIPQSDLDSGQEPQISSPPNPALSPWADIYHLCQGLAAPLTDRLSVLTGFTTDCEAALDRHFLQQSPTSVPLVARDGSLTWAGVFSTPRENRDRAAQAMLRRCSNLKHDCDLDALARFAILKYQCGGKRHQMLGHIRPGVHEVIVRTDLDKLADNTVYWARRDEVQKTYYQTAWLAAKCASLPDGVLASIVPNHQTSHPLPNRSDSRATNGPVQLAHDPRSGEEGWWWAEQAWESYRLMRRASVLDQRHEKRFHPFRYEYGPAMLGSWQHQDPLIAEVIQLKQWGTSFEWDENRPQRLVHAYLASIWANGDELVLDSAWISTQVGAPITDEEWNTARLTAHRILRAQERHVLSPDPTRDRD